jgi:tetratricopeptide (TPR) repeat protein
MMLSFCKRIPALVSCAVLAGLAFSQEASRNDYAKALAAFRSGDLAQSCSLLESIVAARPDDADAQHLLGLAEVMQGRQAQAEPHLTAAAHLEPLRADFRINLAKFYAKTGRPELGVQILSQPAVNEKDARLVEARGLVRSACSDWAGAATDFARTAELDPERLSAWYHLGLMQRAMGNLDAALAAFERALTLAPDDFQTLLASGAILLTRGQRLPARARLERAERINPASSEVQRHLSYLAMQGGDCRSALQFAERAVSLASTSGAAHYQLARVLTCLGREVEAEREFTYFRKCPPEGNSSVAEHWQGLTKRID